MPNGQCTQHKPADRPADCARNSADDEGASDGMRIAMQNGRVPDKSDQRLNVHHHLCAGEYHKAEVAASDRLENSTGTEVKWREWHGWG